MNERERKIWADAAELRGRMIVVHCQRCTRCAAPVGSAPLISAECDEGAVLLVQYLVARVAVGLPGSDQPGIINGCDGSASRETH